MNGGPTAPPSRSIHRQVTTEINLFLFVEIVMLVYQITFCSYANVHLWLIINSCVNLYLWLLCFLANETRILYSQNWSYMRSIYYNANIFLYLNLTERIAA